MAPGGAGSARRANCPATNVTSGAATCSENRLSVHCRRPATLPSIHAVIARPPRLLESALCQRGPDRPPPAAPACTCVPRDSPTPAAFLRRGASRAVRLHGPWARAPRDAAQYAAFRLALRRPARRRTRPSSSLRNDDGALVGVFSFSEIVRGAFKSAYLGYYAFAPLAGSGYMTEGLALALDVAYRRLKLHRVEVNVQPTNRRSLALVARLGFTREGFSRRYVKIGGPLARSRPLRDARRGLGEAAARSARRAKARDEPDRVSARRGAPLTTRRDRRGRAPRRLRRQAGRAGRAPARAEGVDRALRGPRGLHGARAPAIASTSASRPPTRSSSTSTITTASCW